MQNTRKQLRNRTMRKIYGIWFLERVLPGLCLELSVLVVIGIGAQSYISFQHIFNNLMFRYTHHPIVSMGSFWFTALSNTEFIAKILLIGALFVGALIARDALRVSRKVRENFFPYQHVI